MNPMLHLVERSSGIIDPTSGSMDMSELDQAFHNIHVNIPNTRIILSLVNEYEELILPIDKRR